MMTATFVIESVIRTATVVGAIIDTKGYESLEYIITVDDALVGGGFTALLEEDDAAGFGSSSVLPAAERLGALPVTIATDTDKVLRVGVIGKKRYSRLTLTETGTVSGGLIGAIAIQQHPRNAPTAEQDT
jgi:hypothetical protein